MAEVVDVHDQLLVDALQVVDAVGVPDQLPAVGVEVVAVTEVVLAVAVGIPTCWTGASGPNDSVCNLACVRSSPRRPPKSKTGHPLGLARITSKLTLAPNFWHPPVDEEDAEDDGLLEVEGSLRWVLLPVSSRLAP